MKSLGLTIALALTAATLAGAADAKPARHAAKSDYDFSAVTAYMDTGYKGLNYSGASMLVVKNNKTIYEHYFGDFKPSTVVPIASASKWLSAAVIMTLVDEGKIDLDAPISKYMPKFTGKMGTATVRQMLSHSSGLTGIKGEGPTKWNYDETMADYADRTAAGGIMEGDPGTGIRYASVSLQVMGAVAEQVTGKSWNQLVKERIAGPCDMPDTTYIRTPGTGPGDRAAPTKNPMLAAGAKSSLHDYGHFLQMLANHGVYNGKQVISAKSVHEMQKDQTGAEPLLRGTVDRKGRKSHYGLGEWIDEQGPDGHTVQVSSPGAWGFRPWLNLDRHLYGIIMVQRPVGGPLMNATYDSWKLIDLVHEAAEGAK